MLNDSDFRRLLNHYEMPWRGYRKVRKGVMKRIRRHMTLLRCRSASEYISLLDSDRAKEETLHGLLKVTISRFYRDTYLWEHLAKHIIPNLRQQTDTIKIWSAGCSCGEEVYSLKILFSMSFQSSPALNILATDAHTKCLERAQKGRYKKSSLKELSEHTVSRFFIQSQNRKEFMILPELRENIVWQHHNFLSNPPDAKFHIIFLRNNLLTYYNEHIQKVALCKIMKTLVHGGYLITGSHETLPPLELPLVRSEKCKMVYQLKK